MIRGVVTDIDGVIIGDKIGYNSPFPHPDVIARIRRIHASGISVTLCTGKPHYAIRKIIMDCGLNSPHITDGGAILIDPISNTIIKKHVIDPTITAALIKDCIAADMYIEIYTPECYMIQKSQVRENLTPVHTHILQTPPVIVDDLATESTKHEVVKIVPIAINDADIPRLMALCEPYAKHVNVAITTHLIALPHRFGIVTLKGVSKKQSTIDVTSTLNIPLSDFLGIGDSTSDWSFMQLCGFVASVENGSDELKKLVVDKGADHSFIGPSVEENGILPIFDHFKLP